MLAINLLDFARKPLISDRIFKKNEEASNTKKTYLTYSCKVRVAGKTKKVR